MTRPADRRPTRPTTAPLAGLLGPMTTEEVAATTATTLLVPLGATEQHGPHLPLHTDTELALAWAQRVAVALGDALVAPPLPYGSSGEHRMFAGTLSIGAEALRHVVVELVRSAGSSFDRVVMLSGHGGNRAPVTDAVRRLVAEGHEVMHLFPWWPPNGDRAIDAHAGRTETSLMLHVEPDGVRAGLAVPGCTDPLTELMPVLVEAGVGGVSPNGVLGDPTEATASEGESLLSSLVERTVALLGDRSRGRRPEWGSPSVTDYAEAVVETDGYGPETLDKLRREVVGRSREAELVVASLMAGRHLLLEGPPGTGKSTLLRAISHAGDQQMEFVEGNAELTPARLAGHFDPAQVMEAGYSETVWVDGPLIRALRDGKILYLEEINRVPEETLNLLVTVMSEGELTVPRLGRIEADARFRFVAAMNPFDAVGTARISGAIYDRVCRVAMGYQSAEEEVDIAAMASSLPRDHIEKVVEVIRATRSHPEVRVGSSVRGAVDLLLLSEDLGALRQARPTDFAIGLDCALAALSGRIRLHESTNSTPESVVTELWTSIVGAPDDEPAEDGSGDAAGKAPSRLAAAPIRTIGS